LIAAAGADYHAGPVFERPITVISSGSITALVTPCNADGSVDLGAFAEMVS